MPEGSYRGRIKTKKVRWNRRWWNGPWHYSAEIEVANGIPHPGKGSTSYNCSEDATYSMSFCEALDESMLWINELYFTNKFEKNVKEYRRKYSGPNWKPKNGWPKHCNQS